MSAAHQRAVLLDALRRRALTTLQARKELDIMNPAQRISELRAVGVQITTLRTVETTECGRRTRIARYVLTGGDKP